MPSPDSHNNHAVTTIVEHHILPGMDATFEQWSKRIREACRSFPGFMATEVIRPVKPGGHYVTIFRFDSYANLEVWMRSDMRQTLLAETGDFSASPPQVSQYHSLEYLFPVSAATGRPPSREKMMLVTYLGLIAPVYLVPPLVRAHIVADGILVTLCSLAVITPLMVYAIMPLLTRLFRPWLNRE